MSPKIHDLSLNILISFLLINISFSLKSSPIKLEFRKKNHFFTVPMTVGSNNQLFEVQVDTTTSETWLPSINTTYKVQKYDPKSSSTCEILSKEFDIDDEDGNVRGNAIYDSVKIGSYSLDKFGLVLVHSYEQDFKDFPSGKLGLGYRHEHGVDFNWIGSLKAKGYIDKEIFTILPEEEQLVVGGVPPYLEGKNSSFCELVETNDLDDVYRAGWVCELTHIFFGVNTEEKSLEMALEINARVIFDSAYDYISIPKRHLEDFNKNFLQEYYNDSCISIKENEELYFICDDDNNKIQQGSIAFILGGYGYVIPSNKLFKKIEDDKYEMLIRFNKENDDIFSFGYPFTSQFIMAYNAEDKKVEFFGGDKIDVKKDWDTYMAGESPSQKKEKIIKLLIFGGILGSILLIIIICLVVRSYKRRKMDSDIIQGNSMIKNEENH